MKIEAGSATQRNGDTRGPELEWIMWRNRLDSMKLLFVTAVVAGFIVAGGPAAATTPADIEAAARRAFPDASWRVESVVTGDFTCRGLAEHAILGTSKTRDRHRRIRPRPAEACWLDALLGVRARSKVRCAVEGRPRLRGCGA